MCVCCLCVLCMLCVRVCSVYFCVCGVCMCFVCVSGVCVPCVFVGGVCVCVYICVLCVCVYVCVLCVSVCVLCVHTRAPGKASNAGCVQPTLDSFPPNWGSPGATAGSGSGADLGAEDLTFTLPQCRYSSASLGKILEYVPDNTKTENMANFRRASICCFLASFISFRGRVV